MFTSSFLYLLLIYSLRLFFVSPCRLVSGCKPNLNPAGNTLGGQSVAPRRESQSPKDVFVITPEVQISRPGLSRLRISNACQANLYRLMQAVLHDIVSTESPPTGEGDEQCPKRALPIMSLGKGAKRLLHSVSEA